MTPQEIEQLFTAWADAEFGPSPDASIPQTVRYASYFKCFKDTAALVLERAADHCDHLSTRAGNASECADALRNMAKGLG